MAEAEKYGDDFADYVGHSKSFDRKTYASICDLKMKAKYGLWNKTMKVIDIL